MSKTYSLSQAFYVLESVDKMRVRLNFSTVEKTELFFSLKGSCETALAQY